MKEMKSCILFIFVLSVVCTGHVVAQSKQPTEVAIFKNEAQNGSLYFTEDVGPDGVSGNSFVFDPSGDMYLVQYDQRLLYRIKVSSFKIEQIMNIKLPSYWGILKADGKVFEFSDGASGYMSTTYGGEDIVKLQLNKFLPQFIAKNLNFFYHAGILFFIDEKFQLHCVLNPALDQDQNKRNYRNPEQTKLLFKSNSGIDLQGLTIDEKGLMYLNNIFIGPNFMPVVGQWQYYLNQNSIVIGNVQANLLTIPMPKLESSEILECTAIHPSGDIYFLRFNKALNKHILYKIENNWDLEVKLAWERPKK